MHRVLIAYTTTEGQTQKIARHVADTLFDAGASVELLPIAEDSSIALGRFDCAVLAGSVHASHFQRAMSEFAARHADALAGLPTLFLSVSLAAAGHEAEDWRGLDGVVNDLSEATAWTPGQVKHVAGAYQPSRYDLFKRLIMRRIIAAKDPEADPYADKEYTDWADLDQAVRGWVEKVTSA